MANNIQIADANGIVQTVNTTQVLGIHTPHQIIDSGSIAVNNFPVSQTVVVSNFPGTQPVSGAVTVNPSSNIVGKVGIDQTTPGTTNLVSIGTNGLVTVAASTLAAAATLISNGPSLTVANVKASAGNVYGITVVNKIASVIYLQFYNTAGTPTLGTGVTWWIPIAASATVIIAPHPLALGNFTTGIGIGASTTPTSTGTPGTAPDVTIWYL